MSSSGPTPRGPHPVGAIQIEVPSPGDPLDPARVLPCEVWYPAAATEPHREDAGHPLNLPHEAKQDAPPLDQPCPLVGFSHGNSGLRQQSTFLTTHLASWGFVVVAPDHVGNTWSEMLALPDDDTRRAVHRRIRAQRPTDLARSIAALVDEGLAADRRPPIEASAIGVLGHSFGGWTALKTVSIEARIRAACCLAPAAEPFVGRKAFGPGELPLRDDARSLVIAAEDDVLVDLETSIRPLFERLGPTARLELLDRADHFHFCDGLELLHKMHENTPREGLPRPVRPLGELRGESETHDWLRDRVGRFFREHLTPSEERA